MTTKVNMQILDVFRFQHGVTVIVVEGEGNRLLSGPTLAFVTCDNKPIGSVILVSERMPSVHPPRRAFETRDAINIELLRSGRCYLRID